MKKVNIRRLISAVLAVVLVTSLTVGAVAAEAEDIPEVGTEATPENGTEGTQEDRTEATPEVIPEDGTEGIPEEETEAVPADTGLETAPAETTEADTPADVLTFSDVPEDHGFYSAIMDCAAKGITSGYADGTFRPTNSVTRAQFCVMLSRAFYPNEVKKYDTEANQKVWFGPNTKALSAVGVLNNTSFQYAYYSANTMDQVIDRYDMAQIMTNIMAKKGFSATTAQKTEAQKKIGDYKSIPSRYQNAVKNVFALGIITGYSDGTFGGSKIMNRGQACLGNIRLDALNAHTIQKFCNGLSKEQDGHKELSPKTVRVIHGALHTALRQAVEVGYLRTNPADVCKLPKRARKEIKPLDEDSTAVFLDAIRGHRFENIYVTDIFTGLRRGELCGLTWDCVDFKSGTILVNKQLQRKTRGRPAKGEDNHILAMSPKNDKSRTIKPAPFVMDALKAQRARQEEWQRKAGPCWEGDPLGDFVFTDELGHHLIPDTVYRNLKRIMKSIGLPETRLHDLRHTYTVASIQAGDNIKTVQENLGHATPTFTLEVYAHVTDQMKEDSANRMQAYIERVKKGN